MKFIQFSQVNKSFTENKNLIHDLNLLLSEGDVCGVIGRNGEGKTTLLKIIVGEEIPDSGQILFSPATSLGYHTQFLYVEQDEDISIEEYVIKDFKEIYTLYKQISAIATNATDVTESEKIQELLDLQMKFEEFGGYEIQAKLDDALFDLRLSEFSAQESVNHLSGGQKTRLQLAKVMIQDPDILLLDEPTNHLDADTIIWLEKYISSRRGITIIVSHDRQFLNTVTNKILELEKGITTLYFGNYESYKEQKDQLIKRNLEEIKQNKRHLEGLKEALNAKKSLAIKQNVQRADKKTYGRHSRTIMRNKAGKKFRQVKLMQKRVDSETTRNAVIAPKQYRNMHFNVEAAESTGDFALRLFDLDVTIGNKVLLQKAELEVHRGERVAIVGENGSGKTTLLKTLLGYIKSGNGGDIKFGGNSKVGYYSQEHEDINPDFSVIEDFRASIPMLEAEASTYLHNMLFTYEQLYQKVGDLSQGEKSKLALAKLLAKEHNFLILDEPTNHLDIASREVLEDAIQSYKGSILVVSHDAYFLDKIGITNKYRIQNKMLVKE